MPANYDAYLLVSFGGPEKREDVIPFLENVLRGRNVPRERLLEVAEHYYHFDGVSPINRQCRELIAALKSEFESAGIQLPIYWGNRNWHPLLADTVTQMRANGIHRALALATSAYGSYSGCRQYREDIERARAAVPDAPAIDKLPPFADHPGFLSAAAGRLSAALEQLPGADVVYTAHSIPVSMAQSSPYEQQLRATAEKVHQLAGAPGSPTLVYQSRSGPPTQPWLGPDIGDHIRRTDSARLIVNPIGFLSDHMEVLYDLDFEAAAIARERGIEFLRAGTVGTHPDFVHAIREMVQTAMNNGVIACLPDCCPPPQRPAARPQ
ncbi:MAG TPA: ferrochelatase [Bryobacteraceae bacterium]|jgi:ferrochelatase